MAYRTLWIPAFAGMTILMLGFNSVAHAADPKQSLSTVQSRLQQERAEQDALKKKLAAAQGDMQGTQKNLIGLSKNLQDNEKNLSALEDKMAKLQADEKTLTAKLQSDYASMGDLILALERMRRMPPETMLMRPGAPLQTAESAILLRSILPAINTRTEQMKYDLKKLEDIHLALDNDKAKALNTAQALKGQKKDLQAMLGERKNLYEQTRSAYTAQEQAVAKIAAEAKTLEQLVAKIKQQPQEPSRRIADFKVPGGAWRAPLQGKVLVRFGQRDDIGAPSEGIRIAGRAGGLITAPVAGIVRYAGPFRNYGNMVIIEHPGDLHSLISGLSRMDAQVGQKISAGEPVGALPATGADGPPVVYYELRHNGKPVDPSAKFPDLS